MWSFCGLFEFRFLILYFTSIGFRTIFFFVYPRTNICHVGSVQAGSGTVKGLVAFKLKVASNGVGRIGRNFLRFRYFWALSSIKVVAGNGSGAVKSMS